MSLPNPPPELKIITPFLQRAKELTTRYPIISYYCLLQAANIGIKEDIRKKECHIFLKDLFDELERRKQELSKEESINSEENMAKAKLQITTLALNAFRNADNEDRSGKASKKTAKTFHASSTFFEVLNCFGDLDEDIEKKIKYAKWKAADILKAIREGRTPVPGSPVKQAQEFDTESPSPFNLSGGNSQANFQDENGNYSSINNLNNNFENMNINNGFNNVSGDPTDYNDNRQPPPISPRYSNFPPQNNNTGNMNGMNKYNQNADVDNMNPINPMNPVNPMNPINSMNPINPVNPMNPINPMNPMSPMDSMNNMYPPSPNSHPVNPLNNNMNNRMPMNPVNPPNPMNGLGRPMNDNYFGNGSMNNMNNMNNMNPLNYGSNNNNSNSSLGNLNDDLSRMTNNNGNGIYPNNNEMNRTGSNGGMPTNNGNKSPFDIQSLPTVPKNKLKEDQFESISNLPDDDEFNDEPDYPFDPAVILNAQKHSRFAISALQYDDVAAAIKNLKIALDLLKPYEGVPSI